MDGYDVMMTTSDAPVLNSFYAVSTLHDKDLGLLYSPRPQPQGCWDFGISGGARARSVWLLSVGWVWSCGVSGEGEEACEKDEEDVVE